MPRKSRKTKQKEQIKEATRSFARFFSIEDLYSKIKKKNEKIGIATVYRSLKELDKNGEVHSYLCGKRRLYSTENRNHCHFICHKCGRTEHFELKKIDFLKEVEIGQPCHFQVDVHGVCKKCLKNAKSQKD